MPYPQIATSGDDFTVDTWNDTVSDLEISHVSTLGFSVISGLELSIDAGLSMTVSAGRLQGRKIKDFAEFQENVPASQLSWVWIDDDSGALSFTDDGSNPGGNVVCLGQVDTDATDILSFTEVDRQQLRYTLQELSDALPVFQAATIDSLTGDIDNQFCFNTTGKCLMTWNDGLGFWFVLGEDSRWSADAGDGNYTWDIGDERYVLYATTLTAGRTVTLNTTNVPIGKRVTVYRTAGGAFNITIGSTTLAASEQATFIFNGSAWKLETKNAI